MTNRRRITLTHEGWYYALVVAFIVVGAVWQQVNLMIVMAGLMVGPLLLSWRIAVATTRQLRVRRYLPDFVHAADPFAVEIVVRNNRRRLGSWFVVIKDQMRRAGTSSATHAADVEVLLPRVAAGQTTGASYQCSLPERGSYEFGTMSVFTRFPLGLIKCSRRVASEQSIVVLPRLGRLTQRWYELIHSQQAGMRRALHRRALTNGGDFYGVRDWQPSDSRRMIHWRITAKLNELAVRQFEELDNLDVTFVLDLWQTDPTDSTQCQLVETAISFAATAVNDICRQSGTGLRVILLGGEVLQLRGPATSHLGQQVLRELAFRSPATDYTCATKLLDIAGSTAAGQPIIVISTRTDADAGLDGGGPNSDIQFLARRITWLFVGGASAQRCFTIRPDVDESASAKLPQHEPEKSARKRRTAQQAKSPAAIGGGGVMTERLLQISVAIMAVLATTLLGLGQQNVYLPLVAIFAASVSLVFTDAFHWFRLNRGVANLFALVAAGYSLGSFFRFDKEQQLLSIANLLVYLQFILFFQEKTPRVYWQLIVLGLLQVVVAVALSLQMMSATIIIAYMLVGIAGLTFFFLHRESLRVTRRLPRTQVTLRRRPNKRALAQGSAPTRPRAVFTTSPLTLSGELLGSRLVRQIVAMGVLSLFFAVVLFYTVPRRGDAIWQGPGRRLSRTGFSELQDISFDESGLITESDEPVMRVAFRDHASDEHYPLVGRPYFRGVVLVHYSLSKKRWTQRIVRRETNSPLALRKPPANAQLVRQEVVLEPSNGQLLFSVYPCWSDSRTRDRISFDNANEKLILPRSVREHSRGPHRYSILTDAFQNGWQIRATAVPRGRFRSHDDSMSDGLRNLLTDVNCDTRPGGFSDLQDLHAFKGLAERAKQVIKSSAVNDSSNHWQVAQALEAHFRTGDEYRYTLDFRTLQRDAKLDPLEDFVVNHRAGHCEYFAGALALMLRSRNIPARVVVGYVGGEFNPLGGFYQIRQKDAHAWVEAYIAPQHLDRELPLPQGAERAGVWYRLDPTPPGEFAATSSDARSRLTYKIDQFLDYFRFVWSDYVVGLDEQRQKGVYNRLAENRSDVMGGSRVRSWLDTAAQTLGLASSDGGGRLRFNWPVAAGILFGFIVASAVARRLLRRGAGAPPKGFLTRLLSRVWGGMLVGGGRSDLAEAARRPKRVPVEFYGRFVRVVSPLGIVRSEGQTQREFAESIRSRLLQMELDQSTASLPAKIVQAFYRVRFGGAALDTQEQESIEQALSKLEQVLAMHQD